MSDPTDPLTHVHATEFNTQAPLSIRYAWKDEPFAPSEPGLWVESNDGNRVRVPQRLFERLLKVIRRN